MWLLTLIPLTYAIVYISQKNPATVEKVYSSGLYTYIGTSLSTITGIFPFSLAEIIVIFALLFIIAGILWLIYRVISRRIRLKMILSYAKNVVLAFSIIYFIFNTLWGLNYYRLPFAQIANI